MGLAQALQNLSFYVKGISLIFLNNNDGMFYVAIINGMALT